MIGLAVGGAPVDGDTGRAFCSPVDAPRWLPNGALALEREHVFRQELAGAGRTLRQTIAAGRGAFGPAATRLLQSWDQPAANALHRTPWSAGLGGGSSGSSLAPPSPATSAPAAPGVGSSAGASDVVMGDVMDAAPAEALSSDSSGPGVGRGSRRRRGGRRRSRSPSSRADPDRRGPSIPDPVGESVCSSGPWVVEPPHRKALRRRREDVHMGDDFLAGAVRM